MAFIEIHNLEKSFKTDNKSFRVLNNINLSIDKGDIFGIAGFSGAGKSTLIRCLNRLEEPDSGTVIINGREITSLSSSQLKKERRSIGMIFQAFNLFDSKTVAENIAYPLHIEKFKSSTINARVSELLQLVNLEHRSNAYPGALSGGEKQRVGIARAIANEPKVLLSDEATSSLDPQTTFSILELLQKINKKLDLTIILITHELSVIQYICNRMAILEAGKIAEYGDTKNVFSAPSSETLQMFMKVHHQFQQQSLFVEGAGI
ncbi:methionine ABC transporter ATP-binding protein [Pectinatus haikarae]|uniref:D-methionine transport system ATP-binding protein n=1 Tax=Pectinatus haikarae TaxID=349096 RepID=A0ABT9YAK6_9FIRM|nr:methionine ABC transporter ATP-binding protein [Pectinatus haikarae]MDQ0204525.1 D-methionine transport system ATP-binding protein [Pectinatus haikarae]